LSKAWRQDIVVGKGAIESDCIGLGEGDEVLGEVCVVGCVCFDVANIGMNSASSSSSVLLLGSALFTGGGNCGDIDDSRTVSEGFEAEVEELDFHHQPILAAQLERGEDCKGNSEDDYVYERL